MASIWTVEEEDFLKVHETYLNRIGKDITWAQAMSRFITEYNTGEFNGNIHKVLFLLGYYFEGEQGFVIECEILRDPSILGYQAYVRLELMDYPFCIHYTKVEIPNMLDEYPGYNKELIAKKATEGLYNSLIAPEARRLNLSGAKNILKKVLDYCLEHKSHFRQVNY